MKESIFDRKVSVYNGVADNKGIVTSLRAFLTSLNHKDEILHLRTLTDKKERNEIKRKLPMCTISGVFQPTRKTDNLKEHSGLICIDIDAGDNEELKDLENVKAELSKLKEIAYLSLSVSGNGLFAIIPLEYPSYHKQQFEQLKLDFLKLGITIDTACGDVTRMRCMSYDKHPYINESAVPYTGYHTEKKVSYRRKDYTDDKMSAVAKYCDLIESNHIDITSNYKDWVRVAGAFASLGEDGRIFFHICSRQNSGYKVKECDKKFDNLLKTGNKLNIETFLYICSHEYRLKI